jgi:hypothetical protein
VPASTVAGWAHVDQANKGQSSALNFRARKHRGWLSPRRRMEQRPQRHPHLTSPPPQWLAEPTPTELTEAIAAPSPDVHAFTVAAWAKDNQANRCQSTALNCRILHHTCWLSPRRRSEHARTAPSTFVPDTTVAGWDHAD